MTDLKNQKKNDAKAKTNKVKKNVSEVFHYEHKQLILLALFNMVLTFILFLISNYIAKNNIITSYYQFYLLVLVLILTLSSLASSLFVAISPLNLAVVTNKDITIDHNQPLKWEDIEYAQEFLTSSFLKRPVIALHLKEGAKYKLTFMQKLCQYNMFTPFSIPLYAMKLEEQEKIRKIILKHCRYEKTYK